MQELFTKNKKKIQKIFIFNIKIRKIKKNFYVKKFCLDFLIFFNIKFVEYKLKLNILNYII